MVERGEFREDLYHRLNIIRLSVPTLRQRRDEIQLLADFFLKQFRTKLNRRVGDFLPDTRRLLESYSWPGNVRELQNEIERLVLLAEAEREIGPELLSDHIRQTRLAAPRGDRNMKEAIQQLEAVMIQEAMRRFNRNKSRAARALGISRQSLIEKLRRV